MINTEIAGWKRVRKADLASYFKHRILSELTYDNPAYQSLVKHHKRALYGLRKQGKEPPKKLFFWREDAEWYYVPMFYALGAEEAVQHDFRVAPAAVYPSTLLDLRDIQAEALASWEAKGRPSGVFVLPTGSGKTILGIELARRLGVKAIILTGRDEAGIKLWMKDTKAYLGNVVGRIQGEHVENLDAAITVATVQSLWSKKELLAQIAKNYGAVIYDECVALDSEIETPTGKRYFYDMHIGDRISSFNFDKGIVESDFILAESVKSNEVYEIDIEVNGEIRTLKCSPDHPIFKANGVKVHASDLVIGDAVLTL